MSTIQANNSTTPEAIVKKGESYLGKVVGRLPTGVLVAIDFAGETRTGLLRKSELLPIKQSREERFELSC